MRRKKTRQLSWNVENRTFWGTGHKCMKNYGGTPWWVWSTNYFHIWSTLVFHMWFTAFFYTNFLSINFTFQIKAYFETKPEVFASIILGFHITLGLGFKIHPKNMKPFPVLPWRQEEEKCKHNISQYCLELLQSYPFFHEWKILLILTNTLNKRHCSTSQTMQLR